MVIVHTHNHFMALWTLLGELIAEGTFHHLLDFLVQNEDNTGRCTNNPDGMTGDSRDNRVVKTKH